MTDIWSRLVADLAQSTWLEFFAVLCGIASVIFSRKENILVYPVGMINTSIYIYLYISHGLYADASVNGYYTVMSVLGWRLWARQKDGRKALEISMLDRKGRLKSLLFFALCWALLYVILSRFTDSSVPVADAFTSAAAFTAMWLMNQKKLENWTWWIITNLASIPLNFFKHLVFSSFQYLVFLVLAVMGYLSWKKKLQDAIH